MIKTLSHKHIVVLMLLAFTSQIMAVAAMTCDLEKAFEPAAHTMHMNHMNPQDHSSNMDHTHHFDHPMTHMQSDTNGTDHSQTAQHKSFCCKTMVHCLLGCALMGINSSFTFQLEKISLGIEDLYSSAASNPFIPSLYRPPILA